MAHDEATQGPEVVTLQVGEWASSAARAGKHQDVLSWLRALSVVVGGLPAELSTLQNGSFTEVRQKAEAHNQRRARVVAR